VGYCQPWASKCWETAAAWAQFAPWGVAIGTLSYVIALGILLVVAIRYLKPKKDRQRNGDNGGAALGEPSPS
jgi:hypothetical protein